MNRERCAQVFYWPSECLVSKTSARARRAVAAWCMIVSVPTTAVMILLWPTALWIPDSMLVVTVALSFYALVASETPVEPETETGEEPSQAASPASRRAVVAEIIVVALGLIPPKSHDRFLQEVDRITSGQG